MKQTRILILDYGSQYTQLIARRIRELGFYSFILPGDTALSRVEAFEPSAIILSGGPSSVYDSGAPALPEGFLKMRDEQNLPVLGICYGMQLLVQKFGGEVKAAPRREYGRMGVLSEKSSKILSGLGQAAPGGTSFQAWMSHGDETARVPAGFRVSGMSESGAVAAMEHETLPIYGLQFHPEVTHTEEGKKLLDRFLREICGLKADWNMGDLIESETQRIRDLVPAGAHVICALSGGVDSTVAATLVHRAIGDRLHCVFVDTGMLRYEEGNRVMRLFTEQLHLPVTRVNAEERFLSKLAGVSDPETKRKIIGAEFIAIFDEAAKNLEGQLGHLPEFLVQGTLYPDVIESSPPPSDPASGKKHSTTIKSHHNVGGLPKDLRFRLIEPLRDLFKDEVRQMGVKLGVPADFIQRHPFPGPGLAVRCIGDITREKLDTLRLADEIFIQMIREEGLYHEIWQAMAIFLPIRTVGVQGDGRTHDHVVALRAVTSTDGMTADWYHFESKFLARVSSRICNEVKGVNRVVYDISSKPPATIEWE